MYLINLNNNSMVTPNQLLELNVTSGHSLLELTLGVDFFVGPGEYPLVLTMTPAKDFPNNSSFFIVSSFSFTIIFGPVLTITSLIFFLLGFLFIMLEREVITTLPFVNQPLRHPHPRKSMRGHVTPLIQSMFPSDIPLDLIECPDCGKKILEGSAFCPYCGYHLRLFERFYIES